MDIQKLTGVIPAAVIAQIPGIIDTFNINTPLRLAHFLAQTAHESGNFTAITENLNYSAARLIVVFPRYFPTLAVATPYDRVPQKIADRVYASRMGNGDEASGDGYRFCGRGYIQLTGKANYQAFGAFVQPDDLMVDPSLVATKYPLMSAAWFFNNHHLNQVADGGFTDDVVTAITKVINGGVIGLSDRILHFNAIYPLIDIPDDISA